MFLILSVREVCAWMVLVSVLAGVAAILCLVKRVCGSKGVVMWRGLRRGVWCESVCVRE